MPEINLTTEINWLLFIALFSMTFILDFIEVTFVMSVQKTKPLAAAVCRFAIMLIMAIGIMNYVANPLYILPICCGSFCGTYLTIKNKSKNSDV